jgi:hypothetical protein
MRRQLQSLGSGDAGLVINPAGVVSQIEGALQARLGLKERSDRWTRLVAESWKIIRFSAFAETPGPMWKSRSSQFPSTGVSVAWTNRWCHRECTRKCLAVRTSLRENEMKAALEAE